MNQFDEIEDIDDAGFPPWLAGVCLIACVLLVALVTGWLAYQVMQAPAQASIHNTPKGQQQRHDLP